MKLLFIAADGLGFNNAQILGERINLPSGLLKSLPGQMNMSGPAWTSIYTGVPPEKHGVVSTWGHYVEKDIIIRYKDREKIIKKSEGYNTLKYPCIWDYLNSEGITCGLFGIPMAFPVRQNNRWAIAGFCRSLETSDGGLYYNVKSEVEMDIIESFVRIIRASNNIHLDKYGEWVKIRDQINSLDEALDICEENYQKRFDLLGEILNDFPIDCLFLSFEFFDRIGHIYYDTEGEEVLGFAGKWLKYFIETFKAEKIICVADHGITGSIHDYDGGAIGNIELPTSVLDVKDYILGEFNIPLDRDVEIAPLNCDDGSWNKEDEKVKEILKSLGYI